jgi:uncharacterized RDD family membrane protein YckC
MSDSPDEKPSTKDAWEAYQQKLEKWMDPNRWFPRKPKPDPDAVRFVNFNDRMFTTAIDIMLILIVIYPFVLTPLTSLIYQSANPQDLLRAVQQAHSTQELRDILSSDKAAHAMVNLVINYVFQLAVYGFFMVGFWVYAAATPGKWLMRMRVVDAETGLAPTLKQAMLRYLGMFVSPLLAVFVGYYLLSTMEGHLPGTVSILLGFGGLIVLGSLGYIWSVWDKEGQAWHDKLAHTVVVKVKHWRFKASETSEFPDSWFEEEREADLGDQDDELKEVEISGYETADYDEVADSDDRDAHLFTDDGSESDTETHKK